MMSPAASSMQRVSTIAAEPPRHLGDLLIAIRLQHQAPDDWAKAMSCTRSELIRGLIEEGLSLRASAAR
jgi:hypothetical protein